MRSRSAVLWCAITTNLFWTAFLVLWFVAIARDAEAMGIVPEDVHRAEAAIEHALLKLDHAAAEAAHDGIEDVQEGFCRIPPEVIAAEELDPELLDTGMLVPPPKTCETGRDPVTE